MITPPPRPEPLSDDESDHARDENRPDENRNVVVTPPTAGSAGSSHRDTAHPEPPQEG